MRGKLKGLHSADVFNLETWSPGDEPFGFQLDAMIGPAESEGEEEERAHSARSAMAGSTLAARTAGKKLAAKATDKISRQVAARVIGS